MTDDELWDAMIGLYAFNTNGCLCGCGIHDEHLKDKVKAELNDGRKPNQLFSDRLARLLRDRMLSEESIAEGYGLEDVLAVANWVDDGLR